MYDLFTSPNIVILSVLSICWKTSFLLSLLLINPKTKNSSKEELVRGDMIKKPQNLSPFFYVSQYRNSNRFLGLCTDVDLQRIMNKRNTCFLNTFTTFFATRLPEVSSGRVNSIRLINSPKHRLKSIIAYFLRWKRNTVPVRGVHEMFMSVKRLQSTICLPM